jgi:hypothetical protein
MQNVGIKFAKYIGGIIVVQKGECNKMPMYYTVRLICTTGQFKSASLLGAYLYAAREHGQYVGLLEVAGGHMNTVALCAYDKFGFVEDRELHYNCFDDDEITNLPMKVNIKNIDLDDIANVVAGKRLKPPHELCDEFRPNPKDSPKTKKKEEFLQSKIAKYTKLLGG